MSFQSYLRSQEGAFEGGEQCARRYRVVVHRRELHTPCNVLKLLRSKIACARFERVRGPAGLLQPASDETLASEHHFRLGVAEEQLDHFQKELVASKLAEAVERRGIQYFQLA